jgi:hypothetical protein
MRALAAGLLTLCVAVGCAQAPTTTEGEAEKPELSAEAKSLVLDEVPTDIQHPLYIDFNGRAELLGYALEPAAMAAPGSQVSLKLYWRSTGKLDEGYVPFTELVLPDGSRAEVESNGPVRKGELVPQNWERGKVYIDEVGFTVPRDINASRFSIVVGLKTQPVAPEAPAEAADADKDEKKPEAQPEKAAEGTFGAVYLSVLSGPADHRHGGVIASLETGATPGAKRVRAAKDDKQVKGPLKRMPGKPPSAKPVSAKPRTAQ